MRLTGSRAYYRTTPPKMPSGLVELIEGLTREVLKNNPTDIYGFCAGHVQHLLEIRDGPLQKKTLTLEEKIANAQEKVRQRAKQRTQQYNNDLLGQPSGKGPKIKASPIIKDDTPPILPQEPTVVNVLKKPTRNEQDLDNSSEAELSHELCTSENSLFHKIKDLAIKDDDDLEKSIKFEPKDTESKSKSNGASDSYLTQGTNLNEPAKTETPVTKVKLLDNSRAPMADGQLTRAREQSFKEDQEFVAATSALHEFDEVTLDSEQHLSSPIDNINTKQDRGLVDNDTKVTTILSEFEKTADLDDQNSVTQAVNLISNDIVETQSDNVNLSFNKEETQHSNDTESIQHFIDPDITNQSNIIDNVELTTNSDDTVNGNEDPLETNTFDISFKESPTVELQDPQINSDILESLMETNADSDIVTLITQESTNDELKQHIAFKNDAELPEDIEDTSEENGVITAQGLQMNTQPQNQINSIDLVENKNEAKTDNDNSGHEYISTNLDETPQIHSQDSNMDLETAAVTIQKVFRTFLFKSRASTFDDTVNDETIFLNEVNKNKEKCDFPISGPVNERRPHGITRMDTVLQTVNEEKSLSLSTDDSSTMSSAATVIQAHVRGFLVRSKHNSNKTVSTNSLAASNSNEPSLTSLEMDNEQNKNKTVLNIHIVPEGGNYLSRDESLITSMDLSLDSSPPSSINLHPLGYDKSERRKQLKREDAIQSVSPPSNNSGKLSEDVDSVKELSLNDHEITEAHQVENNVVKDDLHQGTSVEEGKKETHTENIPLETIVSDNAEPVMKQKESVEKNNSDEMDVVTPFISYEDNNSSDQNLLHSGEFHDAVLPTKVSRSDTSVASEFKNVLVYFLLWNHS